MKRWAVVMAAWVLACGGCGSGTGVTPDDDQTGRPRPSPLAAGTYRGTSICTSTFEEGDDGLSDPQMLTVDLTVRIGPAGLPVEGEREIQPGDVDAGENEGVTTTTTVVSVEADDSGVAVEKTRRIAINEGSDSARHLEGNVMETYTPAPDGAIVYTLDWTLDAPDEEPFFRWTNQCEATLAPESP